jgi:hypothetical protein
MATMSAKSEKLSSPGKLTAAENGTNGILEPQFSPYLMRPARIRRCKITSTTFTVEIDDGRTLLASTTNLGPVFRAHWKERRRFKVIADGTAVEWPALGYVVALSQIMRVD